MEDREALIRAVIDEPENDTPRLVFSDFLEEKGDKENVAWAKFIRVQCAIAKMNPPRLIACAHRGRNRRVRINADVVTVHQAFNTTERVIFQAHEIIDIDCDGKRFFGVEILHSETCSDSGVSTLYCLPGRRLSQSRLPGGRYRLRSLREWERKLQFGKVPRRQRYWSPPYHHWSRELMTEPDYLIFHISDPELQPGHLCLYAGENDHGERSFSRGFLSHIWCTMPAILEYGPSVVLKTPIEGFKITSREAESIPHVDNVYFQWNKQSYLNGPEFQRVAGISGIPDEIFDKLANPRKNSQWSPYPSKLLANFDLEQAALAWAREKAGLPPLPTPS